MKLVQVPPVASEMKGPASLVTLPSGSVMVTLNPCHLSPFVPAAVGGGIPDPHADGDGWPRPAGFGATLQ